MTKRISCHSIIAVLFLTLVVSTGFAAGDIRTEKVHFKKGTSNAVIKGSIKGYTTVDYLLGARKGQYMNVSMVTNSNANYFNIMAPGEKDVAFFIGSTSGNQYEGTLPANGEYTIRVYQMRSAARRNEVANYSLEISITNGKPSQQNVAVPAKSNDAKVAGTHYNATGNIPCKIGKGQPTGSCAFGVTREGNGSGIVTITRLDGRTRAIFFENGKAIGADTNQADPGEFNARKESDLNIITIGDERYEIPDAVISGG